MHRYMGRPRPTLPRRGAGRLPACLRTKHFVRGCFCVHACIGYVDPAPQAARASAADPGGCMWGPGQGEMANAEAARRMRCRLPVAGMRFEPPDCLHAPFYPLRGTYSCRSSDLIRQHLQEMWAYGIGVMVRGALWAAPWGPVPNACACGPAMRRVVCVSCRSNRHTHGAQGGSVSLTGGGGGHRSIDHMPWW